MARVDARNRGIVMFGFTTSSMDRVLLSEVRSALQSPYYSAPRHAKFDQRYEVLNRLSPEELQAKGLHRSDLARLARSFV